MRMLCLTSQRAKYKQQIANEHYAFDMNYTSGMHYTKDEVKLTPLWRRIGIIVFYLLFLAVSLYFLGILVTLVLTVGQSDGFYSSVSTADTTVAWVLTVIYTIWFIAGTVITIKVFQEKWAMRWLVIQTVATWLVVLPVIILYFFHISGL
jgi:hypothetical protein